MQVTPLSGSNRVFLILQGPHGPFIARAADGLRVAGAKVFRVGFNAGDRVFWGRRDGYIPFRGSIADWPDVLRQILTRHGVTDILLYGDTRPIHATAIEIARENGLGIHVLEEGYLRPYWSTYERQGSNGNSPLTTMSLAQMQARLSQMASDHVEAPDHWGALRAHMFWGAAYHFCVLVGNRGYRNLSPHRNVTVGHEFRLYVRKLVMMPWNWMTNRLARARIKRGAFPYHVALLQLEHDANFKAHSDFESQTDFVRQVIAGFANGAPRHHHLVFKAHPLEDGRVPLPRSIRHYAAEFGIGDRVHYLTSGKLGVLLDGATSATTVNSTSAQQVLWRGLPLKPFGRSVYDKPEFVSHQPLAEFFADPQPPNAEAYRSYRTFLLETSQLPGSYYSARGRRQLVRRLVDALLAATDPYGMETLKLPIKGAAEQQHFDRP